MKEKGREELSPVQERVADLKEQKHLGVLKKGEYVGAFRVHEFYAQLSKYMALIEKIRLIESNAQEAYGMNAVTFCKEVLGIPYNTLKDQRTLLKDTKPHVVAAIKALGYSDYEIGVLKTSEDEEVKALMGNGILRVNNVEVDVSPENMPKIAKHIERIVARSNELEGEKEDLEKKLLSKYDMADRNKKLEEKNKTLEIDKKALERKYDQAKKGLSEDDIRSLGAIQTHKDQFDAIITLVESADVTEYSSKVRADFVAFAEYMHDRVLLMFDFVRNTHVTPGADPVPDAQLDEDREWFTTKYGKGAL